MGHEKEIVGGYKKGKLIGKKIFDLIPYYILVPGSNILDLPIRSPFKKWMDYLEDLGVPYIITRERGSKVQYTRWNKKVVLDNYRLWKELRAPIKGVQKNIFIFTGDFKGR